MDSISPAALMKVSRELYALNNDPPEGIRLIFNEDTISDIQAWIQGPESTPYAGGCFRVRIQLSNDFPNSPPKCFFVTKIFHPNVSKQGDVCVSTLKKDWKKDLGIRHILLVVKCLLIFPNPESALNEEAGRQLLERYDDYAKHARLMTSIHAQSSGLDLFVNQQSNNTYRAATSSSSSNGSNSGSNSHTESGNGGGSSSTCINNNNNNSNNNNNNISNNNSITADIDRNNIKNPSNQDTKLTSLKSGSGRLCSTTCSDPEISSLDVTSIPRLSNGTTSEFPSSSHNRDTNDSSLFDSIYPPKLPQSQELNLSILNLKRKLQQEEKNSDHSNQSKILPSTINRQTLQGLPTHRNQTPLWTQTLLKQQQQQHLTSNNTKHDPLRDKTQENSFNTAIVSKSVLNPKSVYENRKKTLRRL